MTKLYEQPMRAAAVVLAIGATAHYGLAVS
jgi:hypothetical protein